MSEQYTGPETNDLYDGDTDFETFEDISEVGGDEGEDFESQDFSGTEFEQGHKPTKAKADKPSKSAKTEKNELEILDTIEDDDKPAPKKAEKKPTKEEDDEDDLEETTPEETKEAKPKGKPTYMTIDGETLTVDSEALVTVPVDGKNVKVPMSELKKNYSGQVAWDKKFNEVNISQQEVKREREEVERTRSFIEGTKTRIMEVMQDPNANPIDAFNIFLDAVGVDTYDIGEKLFLSNLEETYKVLTMSEVERKAYFLEKKNNHLATKASQRDEALQKAERVNSYRQKVDQLRNSFGVSEADYFDAYEELQSFGIEQKDLTEREIVEWAATKPHRQTVKSLLTPYSEMMSDDTFADLHWKLSQVLLKKQDTVEGIKKSLEQVYGQQAKAEDIRSRLKTVGRPKSEARTQSKKEFESFEDWED